MQLYSNHDYLLLRHHSITTLRHYDTITALRHYGSVIYFDIGNFERGWCNILRRRNAELPNYQVHVYINKYF